MHTIRRRIAQNMLNRLFFAIFFFQGPNRWAQLFCHRCIARRNTAEREKAIRTTKEEINVLCVRDFIAVSVPSAKSTELITANNNNDDNVAGAFSEPCVRACV